MFFVKILLKVLAANLLKCLFMRRRRPA